jgi:hypothetical protein
VKFLNSLAAAFGGAVSNSFDSQITAAEQEAQSVAQAVAVWGVVVAVELGIVIYILARKGKA